MRVSKWITFLLVLLFCAGAFFLFTSKKGIEDTKYLETSEIVENRNEDHDLSDTAGNSSVPAVHSNKSQSYREQVSDYHFKEVTIEYRQGLPYPIRKEEILHVAADGETTVKSSVSYVASQLLLGLNSDDIPPELKELGELKPIGSKRGPSAYILRFPEWNIDSVEEALAVLAAEPLSGLVRYAEPDYVIKTDVLPNDPAIQQGYQWGLGGTSDTRTLNAEAGWSIRTSADDIVVAVLDTGINSTHEDLAGNLWRNDGEIPNNGIDDDHNGYMDDYFGFNTLLENGEVEDDQGHGSHVAGIIGAVGNNALGITGVAWSTNIMTVKIFSSDNLGALSDTVEAVYYAVDNGASVINASWGGSYYSRSLYDAIEYAKNSEVLFVASAGNENNNNDSLPHYPSSYDLLNVIAVGSSGRTGSLSDFSNYGKQSVDLVAPGEDILSAYIGSNSAYAFAGGTSMAAPMVSGVLTLLEQQYKTSGFLSQRARLLLGFAWYDEVDGKVAYSGVPNLQGSLQLDDVPSGFRFNQVMNSQTVVFQGQSTELKVEVEDAEGVTFDWYHNGRLITDTAINRLELPSVGPRDQGNYKVFARLPGLSISDRAEVLVVPNSRYLREAAETAIELGSVGESAWTPTSQNSFFGPTSLVSGRTNSSSSSSSSSLYSRITGAGVLSFQWRVSSEEDFDWLRLKVDGVVEERISGESGWIFQEVTLTGEHEKVIEWEYLKDRSVNEGEDKAFVDHISWIPSDSGIPFLVGQSSDLVLSEGSPARFEVSALGSNLIFQWFKDGLELKDEANPVLEIGSVTEADTGSYWVQVSNENGAVRSDPTGLKVGDFAVEILRDPVDAIAQTGVSVEFRGAATGTHPLGYQWYKNDELMVGKVSPVLTLNEITIQDNGQYHLRVSNAFSPGGAVTKKAELRVESRLTGPQIVKQSSSLVVARGAAARFEVSARGSYPLNYQWYLNDEAVLGENSPALIIPMATEEHTGRYKCEVRNEFGVTYSLPAQLSIIGSPGEAVELPGLKWVYNRPSRLLLISEPAYDSVDSLEITSNPPEGTTFFGTTLTGPVTVSFWHQKGLPVTDTNKLYLIVDGEVVESIESPYFEWKQYSFQIKEPGFHEFQLLAVGYNAISRFYLDQFEIDRKALVQVDPPFKALPLGESVTYEANIFSEEPYSVQWFKDGELLSGETNEILNLEKVKGTDGGNYTVQITNQYGSRESDQLELLVVEESIGQILDAPNSEFLTIGNDYWIPQSEIVKNGPNALRSPDGKTSTIKTKVRGPISGEFWAQRINFDPDGGLVQNSDSDGDWYYWKFDLPERRDYELTWSSREDEVSFLDSFKLYPIFYFANQWPSYPRVYPKYPLELDSGLVGSGDISIRWYAGGILLPEETGPVLRLTYNNLPEHSWIYVVAERDGVLKYGPSATVRQDEGAPVFENSIRDEGFQFYTYGKSGWLLTKAEPFATDGLSFTLKDLPSDFDDTSWGATLSVGPIDPPGEVSFKVKNLSPHGLLTVHASGTPPITIPQKEAWQSFTLKLRDHIQDDFFFSYLVEPPYSPGPIPIYIDDIHYRKVTVLREDIGDQYLTIGSPLYIYAFPLDHYEGTVFNWYKGNTRIPGTTDNREFRIDSISEEDAGDYSVRFDDHSGETSKEEFHIYPQPPIAAVLDAHVESWQLSHPDDWTVVMLDPDTGNQALVSSYDRFDPSVNYNANDHVAVSLKTVVNGPGKLRLRYRFAEAPSPFPVTQFRIHGTSIEDPMDITDEWIDYEGDVTWEGEQTFELLYRHFATDGTEPVSIIVDTFSFEPKSKFVDKPKSKIAYGGDQYTADVKPVSLKTEWVNYSWYKDQELLKSGPDGVFEIDSITLDDFGAYLLKIESNLGEPEEVAFEILNAGNMNNWLGIPDIEIRGEATASTVIKEVDSPGRPDHLGIVRNGEDEKFSAFLTTHIDGPYRIVFDYKSKISSTETGGDSAVIRFSVDGEGSYSLAEQNWTTFDVFHDRPGLHEITWEISSYGGLPETFFEMDKLQFFQTPHFLIQPQGTSILLGSPFILTAKVTGGEGTNLQWFKDNVPLTGETNPYLLVLNAGYSNNGAYQLKATNTFGETFSEVATVTVADDLSSVFPFQSWTRVVQEKSYLKLIQTPGINGGQALQFAPTSNPDISPSMWFSILGPRRIEMVSSVSGSNANHFLMEAVGGSVNSGLASSAGWGRAHLELQQFGFSDVVVKWIAGTRFPTPDYDTTPGLVGQIKASWIEGHPFTQWIKWSLPYNYDTISDFDLTFGDEDGDGISNILEYATLSSASSKNSSIWTERDKAGREENINFYRHTNISGWASNDMDLFEYGLEVSGDLLNWQRIPHQEERFLDPETPEKEHVRISPKPGTVVPQKRCFLRLVVSSNFFLPGYLQNN